MIPVATISFQQNTWRRAGHARSKASASARPIAATVARPTLASVLSRRVTVKRLRSQICPGKRNPRIWRRPSGNCLYSCSQPWRTTCSARGAAPSHAISEFLSTSRKWRARLASQRTRSPGVSNLFRISLNGMTRGPAGRAALPRYGLSCTAIGSDFCPPIADPGRRMCAGLFFKRSAAPKVRAEYRPVASEPHLARDPAPSRLPQAMRREV